MIPLCNMLVFSQFLFTGHYPCSVNNGGCAQTCLTVDTYTEQCECTAGYKLLSNKKSCAGNYMSCHSFEAVLACLFWMDRLHNRQKNWKEVKDGIFYSTIALWKYSYHFTHKNSLFVFIMPNDTHHGIFSKRRFNYYLKFNGIFLELQKWYNRDSLYRSNSSLQDKLSWRYH
jgi:hypothetical protein